MVSKSKLKSELHSFNENLDKHLSSVDLERLDSSLQSTSPQNSHVTDDTGVLLVENLKDIRYELNSMRKNMSTDVATMVEKQIQSLKSDFFDQLLTYQNQVYEQLKSIDFSYLKQMGETIEEIKQQQKQQDKEISTIKEEVGKKLTGFNTLEDKRSEKFIDELHLSHQALLKKINTQEEKFSSIENQMNSLQELINSHKIELDSSLKEFKNNTKQIEQLAQDDSQKQLKNFEDVVNSNKDKVEVLSKNTNMNQNAQKFTQQKESSQVTNYGSGEKILSIDEKLQRINELKNSSSINDN